MKNKVFRALCALVLVCVLLVGWSPIQAKANSLAVAGSAFLNFLEAGAAAAGMSVFSYVAIGLGVTFGAAMLVDAVGEYIDYTGELGAKIYYYPDGTWTYGVDMGFVESVRAFLFDAGYLIQTGPASNFDVHDFPFGSGWPNALLSAINGGHSVVFFEENCGTFNRCYMFNSSDGIVSVSVSSDGRYKVTCSGGTMYFRCEPDYASTFNPRAVSEAYVPAENTVYWHVGGEVIIDNNISAADGVEIGVVAPLDVSMPEAYPEWYGNSRPYVTPGTEEEVAVLPIPYNPTADPDVAPGVLTQPDIWGGSIAEPIPGIGTGSDTTISVTPWETFKTWISTGWQSIIQAIPTAGTIADAIGNVIKSIFVPDADFISEKWNAIRSRFAFADSITATGEVLVNILDGLDPEPPVIYIDLGAAEGSYNIGGEVPFIDLRWYAQYKPTMDMIVSAFLWLAFVWRLILKLPGIISGMPGEFVLMNLPVNLPHLGIGSGQRREELESGRNNRRLGDGH